VSLGGGTQKGKGRKPEFRIRKLNKAERPYKREEVRLGDHMGRKIHSGGATSTIEFKNRYGR